MNKEYYTPESIIEITNELKQSKNDFEFLITCNKSKMEIGDFLNNRMYIQEIAHLIDVCDDFIEVFNEFIEEFNIKSEGV